VEKAAQAVLDARKPHIDGGASLADLYDPLAMPTELLKAHRALDHAVDKSFRQAPFANDRERVEYLFALYEKLAAPLATAPKPKRAGKKAPKPNLGDYVQAQAEAAHHYFVMEEPAPPEG